MVLNKTKRIFNIIEAINQYPALSPNELALKLNVSERSVYRYLRELNAMGFGLQRTKDITDQPIKQMLAPITFSSSEILALVAACQPLLDQSGLPYIEPLQSALQKAKSAMSTIEDKRAFYKMQSHFTFLSETLRDFTPWKETISIINDAIRRNRTVKLTYDSYSGSEVSDRVVNPYDLFFKDGNLYLAAHCHKRNKVRIFRIDRMLKVKLQNETYVSDPSFQLDTYLGSSWRVWRGTEEITIKFIVFPPASRLFKESRYHASQQVENLKNGQSQCSITTYNTPEIKSWLLSWGKQVRVLEPIELAEEIKSELQAALGVYEK